MGEFAPQPVRIAHREWAVRKEEKSEKVQKRGETQRSRRGSITLALREVGPGAIEGKKTGLGIGEKVT